MSGGTTRVAIRKGGMPGDAFPTLGHPPIWVLMAGDTRMSPVMTGK